MKDDPLKIEVRFQDMQASDSLREHALRQVHAHLSRFGRDLAGVTVRIADLNGPRGGVDKRCRITLRGPRLGESSLEERAADGYAAVSAAADKAARRLGRELERVRDDRRAFVRTADDR